MLLKLIELSNYALFQRARFDLSVEPESPLILFTGNNGAGKTSMLEAFRLSLHGRRSFLNGITDLAYDAFIKSRFRNQNVSDPCAIKVAFEFNDLAETHFVELERTWRVKRSRVSEQFTATLDGLPLTGETAEELMVQVLPPEILGFFFFDGEKIGDLADWEHEDDYKLFSSVNELLGLRLVEQLVQDLDRVVMTEHKANTGADLAVLSSAIALLENERTIVLAELKSAKATYAACNRRLERTRQRVASLGGLFADRRKTDERDRDLANAACQAALDAIRQEAGAYLPLLVAPNSLRKLQRGIDISDRLESLGVVDRALREAEPELKSRLAGLGLGNQSSDLINLFLEVIVPKPMVLSEQPLDLSLAEASWMRAIVLTELPRVHSRIAELLCNYDERMRVFQQLDSLLASAPVGDPDVEAALLELQEAQRGFFEAELEVETLRSQLAERDHQISDANERSRKARHEYFRNRRLAKREQLLVKLLTALPDYANSSREAKEARFAELLRDALTTLWHKAGRIVDVQVDLRRRTIKLVGSHGEINKNDLSAAEKQLFAVAFIFALAKLSGKHFPFVVDTPLGRLDHAHREKLIVDFLPSASHQVILFSTDTEIVGSLYERAKPLIHRQYELSEFNGRATAPVQLEVAL